MTPTHELEDDGPGGDVLWAAMPAELQRRVFTDWVERTNLGTMRGDGLWPHVLYLDMIAKEMGCSIGDVLDLGYYPI